MAKSNSADLTFARTFVKGILETNLNHDFAYELYKDMNLVSASQTPISRVVSRLTVTPTMCNPAGTLHGGAICTLVDVCTTVALVTARKWDNPGATRTLSTTCLVPVLAGEEIEVESELLQIGKKMGKRERIFEDPL